MRKELKLLLPMVLGLAMAGFAAYKAFRMSEQAKALPSARAAARMLSPDEKHSCRAVIQKALALGWEDSHNDLAKALAIGRARLPEVQRAYERICEADGEGVQ